MRKYGIYLSSKIKWINGVHCTKFRDSGRSKNWCSQ
jgi:hypothetical protein